MSESSYWYYKLEKIQFAISKLQRAQRVGIEIVIDDLERQEAKAHEDLVEAEEADKDIEGEK